jgi:4-hydroxy-tetrahydrodipicolinate reductase
MGCQIVRELASAASSPAPLDLVGAAASPASRALGTDAGVHAGVAALGVTISAQLAPLLEHADVAIDFSRGSAVESHLADCAAAGVPLLIGTTGAPQSLQPAIDAAAHRIAVLLAPNTSLAVNVLLDLVRRAAKALPDSYEIEIVETHHRHKLDAPSGTALALAAAAVEGREGGTLAERAVYDRHGLSAARKRQQIGIASLRGGDVVGEHQVMLLGDGESLALLHRATDRGVFARGAALAANWLAGQPAGRYTMRDFIDSKSKA